MKVVIKVMDLQDRVLIDLLLRFLDTGNNHQRTYANTSHHPDGYELHPFRPRKFHHGCHPLPLNEVNPVRAVPDSR